MSTSSLANEVLTVLQQVVGEKNKALHEPLFRSEDQQSLMECLKSGYVSTVSNYSTEFEREIAKFTGAKNVVALINGTAALHLALLGIGAKDDKEILVPSLSFAATVNAIRYTGAIPHFVEIESDALTIDVDKLSNYLRRTMIRKGGMTINRFTSRQVIALLPMHTFGHSSRIDELLALAEEFNLQLVEDAAESLGTLYKGKHTGTFGRVGILSFNGNKIVTAGGGGAVLSEDDDLIALIRHISRTAKVQHAWEYFHDQLGYNFRLPGLNAALGLSQMSDLNNKVLLKRHLYSKYDEAFASIRGVKILKEPQYSYSNYWLQTLLLDKADLNLRNEILAVCTNEGYGLRPAWYPLHKLPYLNQFPSMNLEVTENLYSRIINLPSSPQIVS